MRFLAPLFAALLGLLPLPLSAQEATTSFGHGPVPFLLRSTTDIGVARPIMERFSTLHPAFTIRYEQWGSNALFGQSRQDCVSGNTPADAIFSSAIHQMIWLVNAACADAYRSPATAALPDARRWRDELWGITTEPAVIAFNTQLLNGRDVPRTRFALLDALRENPELYRGKIATYDISASGLGYLFAFSDSLEASTFGALMESFARVDAVATCCSAEIIAGVEAGRYLIAYNVLGSYVPKAEAPNVGIILPQDYTLVLSRGYMIPKGATQKAASVALLEFLLTAEGQNLLRQAGLVTVLDAAETDLAPSAQRAIPLSPALLVARDPNRRATLLRFWSDVFRETTP